MNAILKPAAWCCLLLPAMCMAVPPLPPPATLPTGKPAGDPFEVHDGPPVPVPAIKATDLVRFAIKEGQLAAQTMLEPTSLGILTVQGLSEPVNTTITFRGEKPKPPYAPDMFRLECVQQKNGTMVRTSLLFAAGNMNLSRDIVAGASESTIQLTQTGRGEPVRLYMQNLSSGQPATQYAADSFAQFIRRYPAETSHFLRPMLEAFGPQPQLFAVDDALGCTIFPEAYEVDPAARKQILAWVAQLSADDFQRRQQAGDTLEKMGVKAAVFLATMDRTHLDAEQAARVDGIIDACWPRSAVDPQMLREDPGFLLDCLLSNTPSLRRCARAQLDKVLRVPLAYADTADEQARFAQVYALRAKLMLDAPSTRPLSPAPAPLKHGQ